MTSIYVPEGVAIGDVRVVVAKVLIGEYDIEEADEYPGYSIAIDLPEMYNAIYLRNIFQRELGVPLRTTEELDTDVVTH